MTGLEHDFPEQMMPDGRLSIDGFLCVFDVSMVEQRPIQRQTDLTFHILCNLVKTKRPVVLVTTKNDKAHRPFIREAENLLTRKELKNYGIPLVETSAHGNINVENAFMLLGQLMDKTLKARLTKPVGYIEASQVFNEQKHGVTERFMAQIHGVVQHHRMSWKDAELQFSDTSEFLQFLYVCGSREARAKFNSHVKFLEQEKLREKKKEFGDELCTVLKKVFPNLDLIGDR